MRAEAMAEGMAQGIAQGMTQGMTQGRAEGRAEAMAELQKKWEDWNRRRIEAGDGEFNEPPPTIDSTG
jgi:flagellar biosynthesis/type III secretory pathway protein FliH